MSKSDSCLDQIDSDVTQEAGITVDWLKTKPIVATLTNQTKESYGDVLGCRQTSYEELRGRTKGTEYTTPFTTDLKPKDAWVEPNMALDQLMPSDPIYNKNVVVRIDNISQKENIETATGKSLEKYFGVPSKKPTSSPSGHSRPPYTSPFIRVNGEWVNLNKQPCILVRFKDRIGRVLHRLNRWYEEAMLDLVMLHAQRQANKRRDDGLRQQNM